MAKHYMDMTVAEMDAASSLTEQERAAVNSFISSAKALPKTLCVDLDEDEGEIVVSKRITKGCATPVAKLHKRSLLF